MSMQPTRPDHERATAMRIAEAKAAHRRRWALTPLNGMQPIIDGWERAPKPTLRRVIEWAAMGNVGLRCGKASGVLVVDVGAGAVAPPGLPETPTVLTGGGGRHLYYVAPEPCPINTSSILAPRVDSRGEGGQVVYPGSIHPTTGAVYDWAPGLSPEDLPLATLSTDTVRQLGWRPAAERDVPKADRTVEVAWDDESERSLLAAVLMHPECLEHLRPVVRALWSVRHRIIAEHIVSGADAGETVDLVSLRKRLDDAGQLVASGGPSYLTELLDVPPGSSKRAAACAETIKRLAWRRGVMESIDALATSAASDTDHELAGRLADLAGRPQIESLRGALPDALVPGPHKNAAGDYIEQGADDFAKAVLGRLPLGTIYRRGDIPGELVGQPGALEFRELGPNRLRLLIDQNVRCVRWVRRRDEPTPIMVYESCSRDLASLVLDQAATTTEPQHIRQLDLLVRYPVVLGKDLKRAEPGWNQASRVYYDEPTELSGLTPTDDTERARAVLYDLVADFPFRESGDRDNFLGLLLSPIIRPAIDGNVPMHLISSSLERTGKTKLAEQVLGRVILGQPASPMQLAGSDEERDKRILTKLLRGATIIFIDNVREYLDSAAIATLLTGTFYEGRLLGTNTSPSIKNQTVLVATGNNVRATGEIVKRMIPITLQPTSDEPEARTDFKHPDLVGFLTDQRPAALSAILGLIENWRDPKRGGRWMYPHPIGGFERWTALVGGILGMAGAQHWLANMTHWRRMADPYTEDLRTLVREWDAKYHDEVVTASTLYAIAEANALFGFILRSPNERARISAMGSRILDRHVDTPVQGRIIRCHKSGTHRGYSLERTGDAMDATTREWVPTEPETDDEP